MLRGRDVVDAAEEYAQHIPVRVIAHMLGFPQEDADTFRGFVNHVLEGVALPIEQRVDGMIALFDYLRAQVEDHIDNPRDDLTSYLLDAEMDGQQLDVEHVGRTIGLLLIAGIDTTWSAIGASIWHLAGHPADRERLVAEPELLPLAMEELLAGVRAGHHGPTREARHGVERLSDEGGRLGAAPVPGRQPRPGGLRPTPTR